MSSVPLLESYFSRMIRDMLPLHVDSSALLAPLDILQSVTVTHCIMTSCYEKEGASSLYALIRHRHARRWEIESRRTSRPAPTDEVLGVPWCGACQNIPSKLKDTLLFCDLPTTNRDTQLGDTGEKEESKSNSEFWST